MYMLQFLSTDKIVYNTFTFISRFCICQAIPEMDEFTNIA